MQNEIAEIQISILKDNIICLNKLNQLRKDLVVCKMVHNKLSVTAQVINMGRIRNLKKEIKKYTEMTKGI